MIRASAAGHRAHAALSGDGGVARVVAVLSASTYARAGDTLIWLGGAGATLHPRAVLAPIPPRAAVDAELAIDLSAVTRWEPEPTAWSAGSRHALDEGCAALVDELATLGAPDGFAALLLGGATPATTDARLLAAALPAARALAGACAADDARAAADAAVRLLGVGPGLTPAGDDFVGGAFFARALLARAGACDRSRWSVAAAVIDARAAALTHSISAALLGDLLRGEGWQPLHDLAGALARADDVGALDAARRLVRLGHTSGWDLLAGFVAGACGRVPGEPVEPSRRAARRSGLE